VSKQLMEVRDKFSKVLNDPAHLNAQSREIARGFLSSHRWVFTSEAWDEVTISGLVGMMGGLRKRRPALDGVEGTPSLFAEFSIDPIVVVRVVEDGKGPVERNKDLPSLTLPEALDYVARHAKERASNTKRLREWRRLITRVKPYMTKEGMTLAEGLAAAAAHAAAKRKKKAS
jgi:hypothetical protein